MNHEIIAEFGSSNTCTASSRYRGDSGQVLIFKGIDLPEVYEVHFSNSEFGDSKTQLGNSEGVKVPKEYFLTGQDIYAWIYLHDGPDDGRTMYKVRIPIKHRARITDDEIEPEEQSIVSQAVDALNRAINTIDDIKDEMIGPAIAEYLEDHPLDELVTSVNSKVGDVVLNAEDIGAIGTEDLQDAVDEALLQAKQSGEFDGAQGPKGDTPVKGTDYWTDADKNEIVNDVLEALTAMESYQGPYAVDPKFLDQVLETGNKYLTNNITVNAIRVSRTTNAQGGNTIFIGE